MPVEEVRRAGSGSVEVLRVVMVGADGLRSDDADRPVLPADWVVKVHRTAAHAVRDPNLHRAQVALIGNSLPGWSGAESVRVLRTNTPCLPIIIIGTRCREEDVIGALLAGASGYLTKPFTREELGASVSAAVQGKMAFCPYAQKTQLEWWRRTGERVYQSDLSPRQQQILLLLCQNTSQKEIAFNLGITYGTLRLEMCHLYAKLGVHSRGAAVLKIIGLDRRERTPRRLLPQTAHPA